MVRTFVVRTMGIAVTMGVIMAGPVAAQTGTSSIAGVVKDTSGAVLPGVTVEASSPALIEKVRAAVTDGEGRYTIVDLRPGTYAVTFALTGFNTFKRDGIELIANFTATVNGDLRVGALEETITVSGAAPVVDVQSARQQQVYTRELMDNLPANRNYTRIIAQYPATRVLADVGGTNGEYLNPGGVHGSKTDDTSYELDGMVVTGGYGVGGINNEFYFNNGSFQEITTEVSGMSAESMLGGIRFNAIPKEGSNKFAATVFANFANHSMQGNNVTPDLLARGLRDPNSLDKVWDFNPSIGGPLIKDKLWFFNGNRYWGTYSAVAGNYYNLTPNSFGYKYTPDPTRQAQWRQWLREDDLRLTWQAAAKHKIAGYFGTERSDFKDGLGTGGAATVNPDAVGRILFNPNYIVQATWSYPATSRLLFEAGGSLMAARYYTEYQPGQPTNVYTVTEQTTGYTLQGISGKSDWWTRNFFYRASGSYITGSHSLKAGMTLQQGYPGRDSRTTNLYNYNAEIFQLNNGIPNQVTLFTDPIIELENLKANLGLYVQDKWTKNRLTLNGGLRYDSLNAYVPAQDEPAGPWIAARHFDPIYNYPDWKDLSVRMGVAYDVFGDGRTALKASLGRFPLGDGTKGMTAGVNPVLSTVNSATRAWTDNGAGGGIAGNFLPECNMLNPVANGECGAISNVGFGGVHPLTSYSDAVRSGFNIRPYNWEGSVGINHEVTRGLGAGVAYFHRWYGGQTVTQNQAAPTAASYDPFCVTAPTDPLLGSVSGQQICGFMNVKPALFGQVNNLVLPASQFGGTTEYFNGIDATINARLANKMTINGGYSVGKSVWDGCAALAAGVQPLSYGTLDPAAASFLVSSVTAAPSQVFCHQETPWLQQLKLFAVYPLPWDFQVSGNFQSTTGPLITSTYADPTAAAALTLGRPLAGGSKTVTVNLVSPGSQFDKRINQLDARVTRTFKIGATRLQGMVDLYNLLNANPDVTITTTYGPKYLVPTRILTARMVKLGVQLNF